MEKIKELFKFSKTKALGFFIAFAGTAYGFINKDAPTMISGWGMALFLIGGVFAAGVAHHYYWNDYQERKVSWKINYSTLCPLASPLLIEVSNLSRRDIATVSANISA